MKIKLVAIFYFFVIHGAKTQVLPLDSILHYVEINNPEFGVFDGRIKAYNEYVKGAKALDPPQVGTGFFMTPYNPSLWKSDALTGSDGMGSYMIYAQQMITNRTKRNASANYMSRMSAVDSSMKKAMRNEMFAMVKMNYYDGMILKKKLNVIKESEELMNYLIKSTELKYTYGLDKLNAYYKAKAMLGDVQTMKLMFEQESQQKIILLNTLMNRNKNEYFEIDTFYTVKEYESVKTDSTSIVSSRSDYYALTNEIKLLQAKSDYEYSKRLPDYGIRYDHMIPFGTLPQQYSLMFMVTIPIAPWSSKMYTANVKGIQFEIESIKAEQKSLVNNIEGNLENIKIQIANKKQQISLTEKVVVPSMQKNYDTELLAYEQNTEMLFMVLDAWQNLKTAQLTYLDQIMELLSLQVEYEKQLELK